LSSRRRPARQKDVARCRLVLATEIYSPAEGHLFDLLEPEDVVPEWKRWSPILLRPEGLYGTRPGGGWKQSRQTQSHFARPFVQPSGFWLATDCDRGRSVNRFRRFSSITNIVAKSCGYFSPRRTHRPSATHSARQSRMPNIAAFTPPPVARRQADQILQPVTNPDRDRHAGSRYAESNRGLDA